DRSDRGRIVVSGADRASYLQGLLTNDVVALTAGSGCYAVYLTAQGRMIADMWVYETGALMLVTVNGDVKDAVLAKFDQFLFSEDVQLGDVTTTFAQIAVVGPEAAAVIARAIGTIAADALAGLAEHGNVRADWSGTPVIVTRVTDTGEPGFDLYVERDRSAALTAALGAAGGVDVDDQTAETLRIEAGVSRVRRGMDEETIPLEAGIESRAISFTKGCYVGQEVIIRVLHRGHGRVARRLVGLRIDGSSAPAPGAKVLAAEREIGAVTSAAFSPALNQPIALASVRGGVVEPGPSLAIDGAQALVSALPFVPQHRD